MIAVAHCEMLGAETRSDCQAHVAFWHLADMPTALPDVCFEGKSGRGSSLPAPAARAQRRRSTRAGTGPYPTLAYPTVRYGI